jgi:hypothetical protein
MQRVKALKKKSRTKNWGRPRRDDAASDANSYSDEDDKDGWN